MRPTFISQSRELLFNLRTTQTRKQRASGEITSGLRVTKPSDSPSDAAGIVRTHSELARIRQFRENLGGVQAEVRTIDGTLSEAGNVLNRALILATQAANTTQTPQARAAIRTELEGIFRHLVLIANTSHAGRFIFSGSASSTVPFEIDAGSPDGVAYRGDTGSRNVTFPDGRPAQVSLPGDQIFLRPDVFTGSGRAAITPGAAPPSPPLGVGVAFSGAVDGVISADLDSFFVAAGPPGVPAGGETISVTFTNSEGTSNTTITTPPLAGGETTAQIAALLNTEIAANPALAGGLAFSDEGGNLKLVENDTVGSGYSFASSATGGLLSGLEPGGKVGGQSAPEIAAALNARVASDPALAKAGILFTAVNGEIQVDSKVDITFTAIDFARGSSFQSGLAGTHLAGGEHSSNVFGTLNQLIGELKAENLANLPGLVAGLKRAVDQVGGAQGFFGSTLRQIEVTLSTLSEAGVINQQRLSGHQDADLVESISILSQTTSAEQFTLQVLSRRQPTLLDLLA
jgi:flagellar hook-associated protein 3 FlgL